MDILLSSLNWAELQAYIKSPSQPLILSGQSGTGKEYTIRWIVKKARDISTQTECFEYNTLHDNIPIELIRKIRTLHNKTQNHRTYIVIHRADLMSQEAANAFLKQLEEPTQNLCFVLTCESSYSLPETIRSRCEIIDIKPPNDDEIRNFLKDRYSDRTIESAIKISNRRTGLLMALLKDESTHPLKIAIEEVKQTLSASSYDRIKKSSYLYQEAEKIKLMLDAYEIVCVGGMHNSKTKTVGAWQKKVDLILKSKNYIDQNINPKLVLDNLLLNI